MSRPFNINIFNTEAVKNSGTMCYEKIKRCDGCELCCIEFLPDMSFEHGDRRQRFQHSELQRQSDADRDIEVQIRFPLGGE